MDLEKELSNTIISQLQLQPLALLDAFSMLNRDVIQYHNQDGSLTDECIDQAMEHVILSQAGADIRLIENNDYEAKTLLSYGTNKPSPAERQACLAYAMQKEGLELEENLREHGTNPEDFIKNFYDPEFPSGLRQDFLYKSSTIKEPQVYRRLDLSVPLKNKIISHSSPSPEDKGVVDFYLNKGIIDKKIAERHYSF